MTTAAPVMDLMTLERLADRDAIEHLVGVRPDPRYRRAGIFLRGPDGVSRFEYFSEKPEKRVVALQRRVLLREPWHPALQVNIPKDRSGATRPITYTTVRDAGLLYMLHDWLVDLAEAQLNEVAIAYRPHGVMTESVRGAMRMIRERRLYTACILDIRSFYDSLSWKRLHRVIDELPADDDVKALLHELVEIEVMDRKTGKPVPRSRGICQGLNVSPVMANLFMVEFDRWAGRKLRRLGAVVRRYADDIAVFAPTMKAAEDARAIVLGHLQRLGLQPKPGTGEVVNLLAEGRVARWLGLALSTREVGPGGARALAVDVDSGKVDKKTGEIQAEWDAGLLSLQGVHTRLESLRKYYRATLSETHVERVIAKVKNGLQIPKHDADHEPLEQHPREEGGQEEGQVREIHPGERREGGPVPARGLSEVGTPDEGTEDQEVHDTPDVHRLTEPQLRGAEREHVPDVGPVRLWLEVPRWGGHRPRSPGAPAGTCSAAPVPGGIENTITVRVHPKGPRRAVVVIEGRTTETLTVCHADSRSVPEMYLRAASVALQGLRGGAHVVLVVTDPTLAGIAWDRWEPHSVPLARALLGFRREAGRLGVRLVRGHVPQQRERTDGPWPWR